VGGHELLNILRDAGARILVAEESTVTIAEAVRAARNTALETIIVVEEGADASVMSLAELLACAPDEFDLEQHVSAVRPDDLLTLIYTSGTTGAPKGVQITHANAMSQIAAVSARLGLPDGISAISWLPMAHVAERLCALLPDRAWLARHDLRGRPLDREAPRQGPSGVLLRAAAAVGEAPNGRAGAYRRARPVRKRGPGAARRVATVNPPHAVRPGTVGTALDGVEVRLSDDGEVLIRGPVVMAGYRNLPDKTAEAIDSDGWFRSGDVGAFDDDGCLRIVDRIKER
jgi:long-subunit acyl-CoA synthetase (AMP-forming)